nr:PREDICTED: phosphatidylinositol 4-phosphate 5-kinase 10-like isoform X1 [Musa acuminata subsp. malaccensis]
MTHRFHAVPSPPLAGCFDLDSFSPYLEHPPSTFTPTPRLLPPASCLLPPLPLPPITPPSENMEQNLVLSEQEPSYHDFNSTSTFLLRCSIDSKGTQTEFEWTDYSTAVFRKLQEFDDIDINGYIDVIRGHETLRHLSNKKKVSSLHLSGDNRFALKIISKSHMKALLELLPKYYHHVKKYNNTLLAKFYGLHVVQPQGGKKVRFVVIGNILQSDLKIHKHFVLRDSPNSHHVHKTGDEEDLNMTFHLHTSLRHKLLTQLKHDCNFLEEEGIMHYSLLLGMHICSAPFEAILQVHHSSANSAGTDDCDKSSDGAESEHSHADQSFPSDGDDSSSSSPTETEGILGVRMAARAVGSRKKESNLAPPTHATGKNQLNNVFLFLGVIDILQPYSMLKHMEHVIKSLHADSPSVSGLNPRAYSNHFQEYLSKIFPENFDVSDANML